MTFKTGLIAILLAVTASAAERLPLFNAVLSMNGQHRFVLTNEVGASSSWLELGQAFEGYTLKSFDEKTNTLSLEQAGTVKEVKLVNAAIGETPSATPATLADAEAMLQAMRFDDMMAKILDQQKKALRPMFEQSPARMRVPEEHRQRFTELQSKILDETMDAMAGPEMRAAMTKIYSEIFTKEELSAMTSFHSTPAGQSMIDKQPAIQQKMMEVMMGRMAEIGPRMQQMTREFQASIAKPPADAGAAQAPAPSKAPAPGPAPAAK